LGLEITVTVFWFVPQKHAGYGLSVVPPNRREDKDGVEHASRFSDLLHLEVSRASVSQSGLKTGGDAPQMVHVASSWRLRRVKIGDGRIDATGCIRPFYPNFVIFIVLGINGILLI
jgi:hypothetical protein